MDAAGSARRRGEQPLGPGRAAAQGARRALGRSEWIGTVLRIGYCLAPTRRTQRAGRAVCGVASGSAVRKPQQRSRAGVLRRGLATRSRDALEASGPADGRPQLELRIQGPARRRPPDRPRARRPLRRRGQRAAQRRTGPHRRAARRRGDRRPALGRSLRPRLADVFAIQDEVAGKIGAAISAAVQPVEPEQWPGIAAKGTASAPAMSDRVAKDRRWRASATFVSIPGIGEAPPWRCSSRCRSSGCSERKGSQPAVWPR